MPRANPLREIATHLNIALDHMVFVDDNPAECDEVAHALPAVTVVALPAQPEHFVQTLLEPGYFDGLSVSTEDLRRAELYQQRDQAEELRAQSESIEDFYRRLEMEVVFAPVRETSSPAPLSSPRRRISSTSPPSGTSEAELLERQG